MRKLLSARERIHNAMVAHIARDPSRALGVDGKIVYSQREPSAFLWGKKKVDMVFIADASDSYEVVVVEVKLGSRRKKKAFSQLETAINFFSSGREWQKWMQEKVRGRRLPRKEVWLNLVFVVGGNPAGTKLWNKFPDNLLPQRRYLGMYPSEPPKAEKTPQYPTGVTVGDYLNQKRR